MIVTNRTKICLVDGCEKPTFSRQLCSAHYRRWLRHGDPEAGGTPKGAVKKYLETVVFPYTGDECLYWPFAKTKGYGRVWYDGHYHDVHRLVCERVHGIAISSDDDAAHSCGNGQLGCITPKHLRWASRKENAADTIDHGRTTRGEKNTRAKLTKDQVRQIRSLKGVLCEREIGERFGISAAHAGEILRRKTWAWLED